MFDRKGQIVVEKSDDVSEEDLMEKALDFGAEDFISEDDCYVILTDVESFIQVKDSLKDAGYSFVTADFEMIPQTYADITDEQQKSLNKMLDMLEEDDDVQNVFHNLQEELI